MSRSVSPSVDPSDRGEGRDSDEFAALQIESHRALSRAVLVLLLLPTIWFVRADFAVAAGAWVRLSARLAVRLAYVGILLGGIWALSAVRTRLWYERLVFAETVGIAGCVVLLNILRPSSAPLLLRSPLMTIFAIYAGLANRAWWQAGPALGMSVVLVILRVSWPTAGEAGSDVAGDLLVLAFANAIGVMIVRRRQALEGSEMAAWKATRTAGVSLERALAELRILRGIIPICAGCRQVRTEVGEWQHLETYVRQHSEAEFSHGLCPDCLARLYPDFRGEVGRR